MFEIERRALEQHVELRAAPEGSTSVGILLGYAAVFNKESRDLGGWTEIIEPDAFDLESNGRVIARWNHDSNGLLGTTDAATLRLAVDDIGLQYEIDLPNTSLGRDVAELARRKDIAFSSFAFRTPPDGSEWGYNESDQLVRHVTKASLIDVAPVADPAYWDTSASVTRAFDLDAIKASLRSDQVPAATPPWVKAWRQLSAQPRI